MEESTTQFWINKITDDVRKQEKVEFLIFLKEILPWNPKIKVKRIKEKIKELDALLGATE